MEQLNSRQRAAMETRDRILNAALKLFSRKGFNGTAVKEISIMLNISEGLVYHYFPTKMILLLAVYERFALEETDVTDVVENCKDAPLETKIKNLSVQIYTMLEKRKELIFVIFGEALVNPSLAKLVTSITENFTARLSTAISKLSTNNIDSTKLGLLTHAYFGSIFQFFIFNENLAPPEKRMNREEYFDTLVKLYTNGLTNLS